MNAETGIQADYLDCIPTDEILDALISSTNWSCFFQLGTGIGLSIPTLENIQSNNPSDLAEQNRVVLFKWREDQLVKSTIRVLIQALFNIGRGARCLEEALKNVDLNTLIVSQQSRGEGGIPKKPKIKSEQESQSQGKSQNVDRDTLIGLQQSEGKGAIPKKPKIKSEQESQSQGKLHNVDRDTLIGLQQSTSKGAIPKKPKIKSEQKPQSQRKVSKKCSIA